MKVVIEKIVFIFLTKVRTEQFFCLFQLEMFYLNCKFCCELVSESHFLLYGLLKSLLFDQTRLLKTHTHTHKPLLLSQMTWLKKVISGTWSCGISINLMFMCRSALWFWCQTIFMYVHKMKHFAVRDATMRTDDSKTTQKAMGKEWKTLILPKRAI